MNKAEQKRQLKLLPPPERCHMVTRAGEGNGKNKETDASVPEKNIAPITLSCEPELAAGHSIVVPTDLVRSESLSASAKILYLVLCSYAAGASRTLPQSTRLALECGIAESTINDALDELVAAGLVSVEDADRTLFHLNSPARFARLQDATRTRDEMVHIPQELHHGQTEDAQLLIEKLGINEEIAKSLAQLAAGRGCSEGYVAEVVEYVTTTPGIKNPAGCAIELIRRNERRRPPAPPQHIKQRQEKRERQESYAGLDPEKYTSGKYAFLFRPPYPATATLQGEEIEDGEGKGQSESRGEGEGGGEQ